MGRGWRLVSCLAVLVALAVPATVQAVSGPRDLEVTAASCPSARELGTKKATEACAKHGGLAWTEFSMDCDADETLLPGVPVTMQVHFLCGADL